MTPADPQNPALTSEERAAEARRVRRMLKSLYQIAESSSLTGALRDGTAEAMRQYNALLAHLVASGLLRSTALFAPLEGESNWGRVAVAAKLLEGYLAEEVADAEAAAHAKHGGHPNQQIIIGAIPNLGDLDRLKDIGRAIREGLPDALRGEDGDERQAAEEERRAANEERRAETEARRAEVEARRAEAEGQPIPMPDLSPRV